MKEKILGAFHSTKISRRKFRFKIELNRKFPEIRFDNFGPPLEVFLFSGNLEIPEISCSIWHFYTVWIGPSSFSPEKLQDGGEYFESTLHWVQNDLPLVEPVCNRLFFPKTLGSDFFENCGLVVPNFLWVSSTGLHTLPREKFLSFSYHTCRPGSVR